MKHTGTREPCPTLGTLGRSRGMDRDAPSSDGKTSARAQTDGLLDFFSRRGNAEGLVLICLHYPFHSSFKSTKYTFPLRCPPRCSRQKKSNFPQFAPNSSPPFPGRPPAPLPFQPVDPNRGWETPSSKGTQRRHPKKAPCPPQVPPSQH